MQGQCHECVTFPHYAETTICQPGPLQHLNTDRRDSNTIHVQVDTQITRSLVPSTVVSVGSRHNMAWHVAVMGNVTNCKQDMLTHTHYTSTPHLYSPQHSMKEHSENTPDASHPTASSCREWLLARHGKMDGRNLMLDLSRYNSILCSCCALVTLDDTLHQSSVADYMYKTIQ